MAALKEQSSDDYLKAKDLVVKVSFEKDISPEGVLRSKQARSIICELLLLSRKRGRPSMKEEEFNEAA